jgi:hypothetical protein
MPPGRALLPRLLAASLLVAACHRDEPPRKAPATKEAREEARRTLAELERRLAEREAKKRRPEPTRAAASAAAGPAEAPAPPRVDEPPPVASASPPSHDGAFVVDDPVEIGPQGPATASSLGVVMNSRDGELVVARLGKLSRAPTPVAAPVRPFPEGSGPFALGRGPGLSTEFAYWISHGSLVRRRLPTRGPAGPLEILTRDAFDGTRVGVPIAAPGRKLAKIPATVAYIVRPEKEDAPLLARLWTEGAPSALLTAEGNSTHSVSLVQTEAGVLALSVQARMAITPVHARRITFPAGAPALGDDVVVWVGGGIQPLTEMTVLPSGTQDLYGFIPHERSISEFGIARLDIGMSPSMDTKATWLLYPNGIDPAPVAAGHVCGAPALLYAAPESSAPGSSQELVLRTVGDAGAARSVRVASGRAFYFASIAEIDGGALAAWVTDEATSATTIRCGAKK